MPGRRSQGARRREGRAAAATFYAVPLDGSAVVPLRGVGEVRVLDAGPRRPGLFLSIKVVAGELWVRDDDGLAVTVRPAGARR